MIEENVNKFIRKKPKSEFDTIYTNLRRTAFEDINFTSLHQHSVQKKAAVSNESRSATKIWAFDYVSDYQLCMLYPTVR
jgi:hypothetical protein